MKRIITSITFCLLLSACNENKAKSGFKEWETASREDLDVGNSKALKLAHCMEVGVKRDGPAQFGQVSVKCQQNPDTYGAMPVPSPEEHSGEGDSLESRIINCVIRGNDKSKPKHPKPQDYLYWDRILMNCKEGSMTAYRSENGNDKKAHKKTKSVLECVVKMAMLKKLNPKNNPWIEEKCSDYPEAFDLHYE
jgi:hypothetical protein